MTWLVLGNGTVNIDLTTLEKKDKIIVFNDGYLNLKGTCRISNKRISGANAELTVYGPEPFDNFSEVINQIFVRQQYTLNNIPSSGLCVLLALLKHSIAPQVEGMDMLPSLARDIEMSVSKPMPCAYHNWLGERRVILQNRDKLKWPQFNIEPLIRQKSVQMDPFNLLLNLTFQDKHQSLETLRKLSNISSEVWLRHANQNRLLAIEQLFFLARHQNRTKNWWLFDYHSSNFMNDIRHQLAWVQQQLVD